jgi:transposase-like protein
MRPLIIRGPFSMGSHKSPRTHDAWIPPAVTGVDLNRCRNPGCPNFATPPKTREGAPKGAVKDGYIRVGVGSGHFTNVGLQCKYCGETLTMMSNTAVAEEHQRFHHHRELFSAGLACGNEGCANAAHGVHVHPEKYQRFGSTSAGSPRWRCRSCGGTVSAPRTGHHRLRKPEPSEQVLKLLVNKVPMRRICEVAGILPKVLYSRVSRLAVQCRHLPTIMSGNSYSEHDCPIFI